MQKYVSVSKISVAGNLHRFVTEEALPGTGIDPAYFWAGFSSIVHDLAPIIKDLLQERDHLQQQIDQYHRNCRNGRIDPAAYRSLLERIGYITEEPADFAITTSGVDTEITQQAAPQLVVPLLNARFAVNAANARWGSLYDALYGTDAIPTSGNFNFSSTYNRSRGDKVVSSGRAFLDEHFALLEGAHAAATGYGVDTDGLFVKQGRLTSRLADPMQFVGYRGTRDSPDAVVLVHHGLNVEVLIDHNDRIGADDPAGVKDLILEAAVSSIMDLEDSVAAVDADDKVAGYRNWLGLMKGTLNADVDKGDGVFPRRLNADRACTSLSGEQVRIHGRALMFVRHVGHHMYTDAVLDEHGELVPEGIVDALVTALASVHDLRKTPGAPGMRNSRTGSMYIVKPKMHGPEEVALTCRLFERVEAVLGLPEWSLKIGIMDEERRTTVNLKACVFAARDRVVFINTGFLDRTGDEIHTSMLAGPFLRKAELKDQPYLIAYEKANVQTALATGFRGRAQIGKGMWAMPDRMKDMLEQKIAHPKSGATTAWVPSPTAATLHALHYHEVDVFAVQEKIANQPHVGIDPILEVPVIAQASWSEAEKRAEVENNTQSILGYVVRWIDQGIGCSKVLDINDVALMEDRATLRISSQLLANWLTHGVVTEDAILAGLRRAAALVNRQNAADDLYRPIRLDGSEDNLAYAAAKELILAGSSLPNGYTEPILHRFRRMRKDEV